MQQQRVRKLVDLDNHDVRRAYKRWAPVYDATFGKLVEAGVRQTTALANTFDGRLLEVGVGTGLALPHYKSSLSVTGVDISRDMLQRARERVSKLGLGNVEALLEMDATALDFPDQSFDVTVAMYVMTVVPDPAQVMHEMARVTRPGGAIIVANHFSVEKGLRGAVEKRFAGFADVLGWRPEFPQAALMVSKKLRLVQSRPVRPFGFFTQLLFRRLP
jgi:phosphatidylethanolamine/phosphatidyl-N-methylethanolamine N-methyltransferase